MWGDGETCGRLKTLTHSPSLDLRWMDLELHKHIILALGEGMGRAGARLRFSGLELSDLR